MTTQTEPGLDAATLAAALARIADARAYAADTADGYGFPDGAAHIEALAAVAEAAVFFTIESIHQGAPWWWLDDSCLGCGCDAFSWEILAHDDDCPALALDAALARLATGGTDAEQD